MRTIIVHRSWVIEQLDNPTEAEITAYVNALPVGSYDGQVVEILDEPEETHPAALTGLVPNEEEDSKNVE